MYFSNNFDVFCVQSNYLDHTRTYFVINKHFSHLLRHDFIKKNFWGKIICLKSEIFEIFSKLKKDTDKRSFSNDHPPYASPECPWWLWHQTNAKIKKKIQKTHFQAPPTIIKIAISRKLLVRFFSTTSTRRHNSPF